MHAAEVVWYVTGRFFATGKKLVDVGYFLHLQGIESRLFDGAISESTALFTFAAEPFDSPTITNGGLSIGLDKRGVFTIYLREQGGATFDDPSSFAQGQRIATFERVAIVPTVKTTVLLANVFTARLVESAPFTFGGAVYDFRELVGYGVTQWGTAMAESTSADGVPFVGSAVRVGRPELPK
jgi:hypothetical protein